MPYSRAKDILLLAKIETIRMARLHGRIRILETSRIAVNSWLLWPIRKATMLWKISWFAHVRVRVRTTNQTKHSSSFMLASNCRTDMEEKYTATLRHRTEIYQIRTRTKFAEKWVSRRVPLLKIFYRIYELIYKLAFSKNVRFDCDRIRDCRSPSDSWFDTWFNCSNHRHNPPRSYFYWTYCRWKQRDDEIVFTFL